MKVIIFFYPQTKVPHTQTEKFLPHAPLKLDSYKRDLSPDSAKEVAVADKLMCINSLYPAKPDTPSVSNTSTVEKYSLSSLKKIGTIKIMKYFQNNGDCM